MTWVAALTAAAAAVLAWAASWRCAHLVYRAGQLIDELGRCASIDPDFNLACTRVDGHGRKHRSENGWTW